MGYALPPGRALSEIADAMTFSFRSLAFLLSALVFSAVHGLAAGAPKTCQECHPTVARQAFPATAHKPLLDGNCRWCHKSHGNANVNLLHEGGGRALCVICHKGFKKPADERPAHRFETKGECGACHGSHDTGQKRLLRKPTQELCLSCHAEIKARTTSAHPHPATDDCLACHQPHPSATRNLLKKGAPGQCDTCHDLGALSKSHSGTPLKASACATCHNPHGSKDKGMLRDRMHAPFAPGQCTDCHKPASVDLVKPVPGLCQFDDDQSNAEFGR